MAAPPRPLDPISGAEILIPIPHAVTHEGEHFTVSYESSVVDVPTGMGDATTVLMIAPATGSIHVIVDVSASNATSFSIGESASLPGAPGSGTTLVASNKDRNSANTTTIIGETFNVAQSATFGLAPDRLLHYETIAMATGSPQVGVQNATPRGQREFIMRPNYFYSFELADLTLFLLTNHVIELNWYETT